MKISLLFILSLIYQLLPAQSVLTLEEAVTIALAENYGIQITKLEQIAVQAQVYKSNAGMGPTVDWNVNFSMTGNNVNQQFIDDRKVSRFGRSFNPNTNLTLGLTLFDGGRMEAIYDRLGKLSEFSELQGKLIIQNTILDVMTTYYDLIRHQETVAYLNTIIKNYEERVQITEERWHVGRGSKIDYLQSMTDLNAQLSELAIAENNLRNSKVILNGILNREPSMDFEIETRYEADLNYNLSELMVQAVTKNREILLAQKATDISLTNEKEAMAANAPQVDLQGSLGYAYSNTNAGFLLSNRTIAATAALSARYNIFDGSHRKRQIEISRINTSILEKQHERLEAQIKNDLTFAFNQFESDQELLTFELANRDIAEENLSISLEKFRLGASTILELNEAQRTYDTALNRLVNAQYNIKISSLELLRLSGNLID